MAEVEEEEVHNPLPPPPRPGKKGRGGGNEDSQLENLSNDDFRRMVMDTPRLGEEKKNKSSKRKEEGERRKPYRPKPKEPTEEEIQAAKYRDRAKERREDQNPDYVGAAVLPFGGLNAVPPPGTTNIHTSDLYKVSIENSKYLGGDVEHTHLVKGLDYALLSKVRSEMQKKREEDIEANDEKAAQEAAARAVKAAAQEEQALTFRTGSAKSIYQLLVKPYKVTKANEMFLPRRTAFVFDLDEDFANEIATTIHRSKADCPPPEDLIQVSVDGAVLERIAKIMAYLRLGSSGKNHKKSKRKEKAEAKPHSIVTLAGEEIFHLEEEGPPEQDNEKGNKKTETPKPKDDGADIFDDAGKDYVPTLPKTQPPQPDAPPPPPRTSYFNETGPPEEELPPPPPPPEYPQGSLGPMQGPSLGPMQGPSLGPDLGPMQGPSLGPMQGGDAPPLFDEWGYPIEQNGEMTQEQKDKGMASVFKRDDERLFKKSKEGKDVREKDPGFVSDTYAECYPGYQEFNREVLEESDEEGDVSKMDLGAKAKGRMHRWDFETEEEWEKYNGTKEAMPKAAYQFGVKMADGRKTKKTQSKEHKLNNELAQITKMIEKKTKEGSRFASYGEEGGEQASKRAKHDH